jgi:predicted permease
VQSSVIIVAISAVAQVFVVCAAGGLLARRGVLDGKGRQTLSRLVFELLLPCLLFSKIAASFDPQEFSKLWILPVTALVYVFSGIGLGFIAAAVGRPSEEFRRGQIAAAAFGNSGYLPMMLIVAVTGAAPWLADDPEAGTRGVGYVSLYLVSYSVIFWGSAFPWLGGGKPQLKQMITPPILATLGAIVVVAIPPAIAFWQESQLAQPVAAAATMLGAAAIPGAMLLLGANLADAPRSKGNARIIATTAAARLIGIPLIGILWVSMLDRWGLLTDDPVLQLVLLLESATPSAMNLIVMCQIHKRGEVEMSRLIAAMYVIGLFTMTTCIAVHLRIVFGS